MARIKPLLPSFIFYYTQAKIWSKIQRFGNPVKMAGRHIILSERIPGSEIDSMLGLVVLDITQPLRAYAPKKPKSPKHIMPSILPTPVLTTDQKHLIQNNVSREFQMGLTRLFGLDLAKTNEERFSLESAIVRRYTLQQNTSVFNELMKDAAYNREVRELFSNHAVDKAYFVTGFLTTDGGKWTRGTAHGGSTGVNFTVPVSVLTTLAPSGFDPHFGVTSAQGSERENEFTTETTEIFAVAYDVVKSKRVFDRTAPGFLKTRNDIILGSSFVVSSKHLAMGGEEDEIVEEEDELVDAHANPRYEFMIAGGLNPREFGDIVGVRYFDIANGEA